MFQQMLNSSIAVLRRPSVATFEEHEKNDLGAATVYVIIGSIISAIFGAIGFTIQRPYIEQQLRELNRQFGAGSPFQNLMGGQSIGGAIASNLIGTLIGFFIYLGLVYFIGRAFGGTGNFGELAYDTSLFTVPLAVLSAFIRIFSIGPLALLTGLISLALAIYNVYLTYLTIQSGMNLPSNKALYVILILIAIPILLACLFAILIGGLIASTNPS